MEGDKPKEGAGRPLGFAPPLFPLLKGARADSQGAGKPLLAEPGRLPDGQKPMGPGGGPFNPAFAGVEVVQDGLSGLKPRRQVFPVGPRRFHPPRLGGRHGFPPFGCVAR